jgi:hypothetical protein
VSARFAAALVVALSAAFVWIVGHRGVFLLDQSILFDGAWRVVQGQLPYRDFVTAFPPLPFFLLAGGFRLFGVDFSTTVLAAALGNAAAAGLAMWIVARLLPGRALAAGVAGLLTGVWFQAPFGTLWFEQTAFGFDLSALALLVGAADAGARRAASLEVGAGALLALAMLAKQNAGVEFVPVALGCVIVSRLRTPRRAALGVARVGAGGVLVGAAFGLWLFANGALEGFWQSYVVLTRQIGADRVDPATTLLGMLTLGAIWPHSWIAIGALAAGVVALRRTGVRVAKLTLVAWIVVGVVAFQNLFRLHTDNELENSLPFAGLALGLGVGLLGEAFRSRRDSFLRDRVAVAACAGAGALAVAYTFAAGASHSWSRSVQQFPPGARFAERLDVPGMRRVRWGEPTFVNHTERRPVLQRREFEELNAWLAAADSSFFVFPDATLLYGLHGRPSPQPWLYFSPGHSFLWEDLPEVDAAVVAALRESDVRAVVLETESWLGHDRLIQHMPALRGFLDREFEKVRAFGIFEVWQRRR